tara:strand:- start:270 stop:1772 length:1503 start_codon:yes stop_codon:yes gene_type:complete
MWDVVLSSSVTENGYDIVQCTGVPTLSLVQRRTKSIDVLIPTDFLTIKDAIDFYMASTVFANKYINIIIETGHLLTNGAEFRHGDFSRFRILPQQAVDVVKLDPAFVGVSIGDPDYIPGIVVASSGLPLFYGVDCVMPELWALIDMENLYGEGILIVNSKMFVYQECGVINAGERGLNARNSQVFATNTNWSGANSTGVRAQLGSSVQVGGANIDNCCKTLEQSNGAVYVSRASILELRFATVRNSGGVALQARRSVVSASDVDFTGSALQAVISESASKIDAVTSFAGGSSPSNVLYECRFNSELTLGSVTVTTPNNPALVFRIRSGGQISLNNISTIDGVTVTRANVYLATGAPRFEFNLTSGYGVVYKEDEPATNNFQTKGIWSVNFMTSNKFVAWTTATEILSTGTVLPNAFSTQLTLPAADASLTSIESYSVSVDGRTSVNGGGNRIFVHSCVGNGNYTQNEFKILNTGQRLDGAFNNLSIESLGVKVILYGTYT